MLSKSKTAENKTAQKHGLAPVEYVRVRRAHDFGNGRIAFDCDLDNLVTIYGCTYIEGVKDGKEYSFVSMPQVKGSDGNYYNRVYFIVNDEIKDQIIKQLEDLLK